mgnify:CR=1 FL=1
MRASHESALYTRLSLLPSRSKIRGSFFSLYSFHVFIWRLKARPLVLTGGTTIYFVKQHFEAIKQQLHEVLAKVEELREVIRDHVAKTEGLERRVVTMELEQAKIEGRMERLELRAARSGHGG